MRQSYRYLFLSALAGSVALVAMLTVGLVAAGPVWP
jgi:hypothetical protein